ncbi:MAG: response regulator transcription factor [Anaerolineales bacterium]|nr:response regulator transcription factor [Anaerolineales bacterium]
MAVLNDRFRGNEPLVLIVEDEETQSCPLSEAILREGMRCRVCRTAVEGYTQAIRLRPDMYVVDVNLQKEGEGFELVEQIRQVTLAPILILTGRTTQQDDALLAVIKNATSYLNKTTAPPKVVASFVKQQLISLGKMKPNSLRLGEMVLDMDARELYFEGRKKTLTPRLAEICACLMEPPGGRKPSELLASRIYNDDDESAVIAVRTHVNRLKKSLAEISPRLSVSGQRNKGYCFLLDGEPLQNARLYEG